MAGETVLVFDVGTTNFKTILFDPDGSPLFIDAIPFRPAYGSEGMVLQDPLAWRNAVVLGGGRAAGHAREKGLSVAGVSVTASRSSVIPVDKNGNHVAPAMMWQETASRDIVNALVRSDVGGRIYARTGSRPNTVFSAPKMTWLRRTRPEVYGAAHKLVGIQDYIIRFLTGDFVTDHTFGSRTLLMDVARREWDDEMLTVFQVDRDKLCRLIVPGSVAGRLTAEASRALGLPEGLPVVTAGGDQQNAALGAGVMRPGDVMVNMGTGSFLVAALDEPVVDAGMRVMCNASAIPDRWILDAGMLATGSVHRWFVENFYGAGGDDAYRAAEEEAIAAEAGAGGLYVLPHFSGCGAPHWDNRAKGVFYGLTLGHGRRDMIRAVFEGIAGEIAENLSVADELIPEELKIRLAGGLSRSGFFDQLLADVSRRPLRLSPVLESTALGAWSQAAVALGMAADHEDALRRAAAPDGAEASAFLPNPSLSETYRVFLERRIKLFDGLAVARDGGL